MGCEGLGAGHDVMTMIGDALKENGNGRHVNDVWGKKKSPEPPNDFSAGDSGTECTVRRVSMFAAVLLPSVQHCCYPPEQHISPLELLPAVLASLKLPAPQGCRCPLSSTGRCPVTPCCACSIVLKSSFGLSIRHPREP